RRVGEVSFGSIVLKNSKIAGLRKSRECSALAISTAARLRRIDTSASDRFFGNRYGPSPRSERDAPAVLRIFSHKRKRTFSTQSVISGLVEAADQTLPLRQKTSADNACSIRLRQPRVDLFPQHTEVDRFCQQPARAAGERLAF